jgi:hypothetical protein
MSDKDNKDAYKKHVINQVKAKGQFIFSIEFIEVSGDGIVTGTHINPDFFPGPEAAAKIATEIKEYFMKEMERIGAFKPTNVLIH